MNDHFEQRVVAGGNAYDKVDQGENEPGRDENQGPVDFSGHATLVDGRRDEIERNCEREAKDDD